MFQKNELRVFKSDRRWPNIKIASDQHLADEDRRAPPVIQLLFK